MNTLSTTLSALGHSLAWALAYSLWQGLLIFAALFVLLKAIAGASARTKYTLSYGAFTAMLLWFADTWLTQYQKLKGITVYISEPVAGTSYSATHALKTAPATIDSSAIIHSLNAALENYFPFIMAAYCLGLAFMVCRFVADILQVSNLRGSAITLPDEKWQLFTNEWKEKLGIARHVELRLSRRITVPMMCGIIKPIILLPVATLNNLTTEEAETILLHELAHIKRHDYLLNIVQVIAETILFFNPFVWLISATIRREREHCCDDMVMQCVARPLMYARALTVLEQNLLHNGLAQAATGQKNQLLNRIKRIMEMKKNNTNYSRTAFVVLVLIAVLFTAAMFTSSPSRAQQVKADKDADTSQPKKVYKKTIVIDKNGKRKEVTKTVVPGNKELIDEDEDDVHVSFSDGEPHGARSVVIRKRNCGDGVDKVIEDIAIASKDFAGAMAEMNAELSAVDWEEVRMEIHKALDEVDRELNGKLRKQISVEVRKDLEKARGELEAAREEMRHAHGKAARERAEMYRATADERRAEAENRRHEAENRRHEADNRRHEAEERRAEANERRAAATARSGNTRATLSIGGGSHSDSKEIEEALKEMEHDGLIDRSQRFRVEVDNGELFVNGKIQSEATYNKYKRILKHNNIMIKGSKDNLSVSIND
ncbi:MAG: M56 family metallopeptidase [Bacteroidota bacterium]